MVKGAVVLQSKCWLLSVLGALSTLSEPATASAQVAHPPVVRLEVEPAGGLPNGPATTLDASLLAAALGYTPAAHSPADRLHLELEPLFKDCVDLLRRTGIPLQTIDDPRDTHRIGVAASFDLGPGVPALSFHAGKALPELFGAFSAAHSFSWALAWPVQRFTLRLEGSDRKEFGYFAIAGVQWSHPARPLAVGFGVPLQVGRSDVIGAIIQVRMKFQ